MKIHFDGRQYHTLADLPPAGRELLHRLTEHLPDLDGNGIPDSLESGPGDVEITLVSPHKLVINRRTYHSVTEVGGVDQQLLQQMRGLLNQIEGRLAPVQPQGSWEEERPSGSPMTTHWPQQQPAPFNWSALAWRLLPTALFLVGLLIVMLFLSYLNNALTRAVFPIDP